MSIPIIFKGFLPQYTATKVWDSRCGEITAPDDRLSKLIAGWEWEDVVVISAEALESLECDAATANGRIDGLVAVLREYTKDSAEWAEVVMYFKDWIAANVEADKYLPEFEGVDGLEDVVRSLFRERESLKQEIVILKKKLDDAEFKVSWANYD